MKLTNAQAGYFEIREGEGDSGWYLDFNCPCGCGDNSCIPIHKAGSVKTWTESWEWDGDQAQPTLSPSILRLAGCRFHGYLRGGDWSSCGDGAPLAVNCYRAAAGQSLN